ncbi:LysR substrate-binding domain-containing protein [Acaryochloris marina]|uniref:LysR substrate-binding domain-containing protein n=1 Tax=Acaryochloris marina TaxID=155978 RepID=UPI001BAEAF94|nr:LysR substrate-binding domain-containing protein [Acaryochloris marina]QUY41990.1 LysR family transcriptional regulator [Acaryochloris marina S15]
MLTTNGPTTLLEDIEVPLNLPFTLNQLQLMDAIARTGNFTKAADQLFISQPTASQRVHHLERDLDVTLFHRSHQKVQLTHSGEILLRYCHRILGLCQDAQQALLEQKNLEAGNLVIGASTTLGSYLLPRLIGHYRQLYPQTPVQLQISTTSQICQGIADGQTDIAIVEGPIPFKLRELTQVTMESEEPIVLIVPSSHPFTSISAIEFQDLYQLKFIVLDSQQPPHSVIDQDLVIGDVDLKRLQPEMSFGSLEAIKNAVQFGLGAAFVPLMSIQKELELGLLHQVDIKHLMIRQKISVLESLKHYRPSTTDLFQKQILKSYFHSSIAEQSDAISS